MPQLGADLLQRVPLHHATVGVMHATGLAKPFLRVEQAAGVVKNTAASAPVCDARPTCHSWQKNTAPFALTALTMGFHASTCSSVKMPGVLGSLQGNKPSGSEWHHQLHDTLLQGYRYTLTRGVAGVALMLRALILPSMCSYCCTCCR